MDGDPDRPDEDLPLTPEETLRLIERQSAEATRRLTGDPLLYYWPWGLAWFAGFGALFLHYGLSGEPYAPISMAVALAVLFGAMAVAMTFTIWVSVRSGTHIRGGSQERGMMYGLCWSVGFIGVGLICSRFGRPDWLQPQEIGLLWASVSLLLVGVLFMAGAAVFREWPMFFIGVAVSVLNLIGTAAGAGWHALLVSVLGGGGFLATGVVLRRRGERG
ncbi:hypothetical protein Misp01_17860 [Microtetraspora sp. NBRC 13810]|uniref:hypothetical protein n=1 Tax=Microtetraspora sp. NBRC 13810 TaxID=3030990 RepID=UPI0024A36A7E|nr:hypothetical protein [Microtetraspora sp. NBRC 13810]GLW06656.1 hypothetical protein Misp01_17860 [Microtetraspora sp. NBRC 13810]